MLAKVRRLIVALRPFTRLGFVALLTLGILLSPFIMNTSNKALASSGLLDRARLGTWRLPAQANPPLAPHGYQESDFIYADGKYYLFSTGSQDPAWVNVYVGSTPEDLVRQPPKFTKVAPIRYPSVVKDGNTWHMWGVNPIRKWTEHWVSNGSDPTNFVRVDSPFLGYSRLPVVDFAVRKHPTNGYWYGIGFETAYNSPLVLTRAQGPNGPWEKLNYPSNSPTSGVFGDVGTPPWASAARPDPNLAFTPDGRAWVFFTGNAGPTPLRPSPAYRPGMVEVDINTGKAIGNAVVLYDHQTYQNLPFTVASDLNLVSAPGQPDRIFAETNSSSYPLAVLDLPGHVTPTDGRTSADLARLDMARGLSVAVGITPIIMRTPYHWESDGLIVDANYGGAASYLDAAYLSDLTFNVDFTPTKINSSTVNTVAYIGGTDYNAGSSITVAIDATKNAPPIIVTIRGVGSSSVTLNSGIIAKANTRYSVVVRRVGSTVTLEVNGAIKAETTYGEMLTGLQIWSLAAQATRSQHARYPFQGTIHSFVVTGTAD